MVQLVLAAIVIAASFLFFRRVNELCVLRAHAGKVRIVRGRIPQRLLDDIADVMARSQASGIELRVVSEGGMPQLVTRGNLSPELAQRLRNVLGAWTVSQLRNAPKKRRP